MEGACQAACRSRLRMGVLIMFEVFSLRDLQNVKSALLIGMRHSAAWSLPDMLAAIENELAGRGPGPGTEQTSEANLKKCPQCEDGVLVPACKRVEGLKRVGCKVCRYSEVVD